MDKISYSLGMGIGQNLLGMGATEVSIEDFAKGVEDILRGKAPAIDHKEAQIIVSQYIDELDKKMTEARKKANKEFLEANKERKEVVTLPSGLQYEVLKEGKAGGAHPKADNKVECHYEGRLLDGTVFDSSIQRGQPAVFGVNQVIAGWVEALQLMTEGAKWRLFVPDNLAYGEHGAGNSIPPYSALIFDVELLNIL